MNPSGKRKSTSNYFYKIYNLITQKVANKDANFGDQTIKWGDNDRYPLDVLNAIYDSDTATALYETYSRFIVGSGFSIKELNTMPANRQDNLLKVASLAADQLAMLKGCAFHILTNAAGDPVEIYNLPIEGMRLCLPEDRSSNVIKEVKYNPYWGDGKRRLIRNDITYYLWDNDPIKRQQIIKDCLSKNKGKEFPGFVYYHFESKPLSYFYPKPLSINNLNLLKVDARITQFHESNLAKNMFIAAILNIPGNGQDRIAVEYDETGKPTRYKTRAELLDEQMSAIATGSENAGSLLVNWTRDSAGNAATFSSPPNITNDQLFLNLEGSVVDKIARLVRVPPILANIQVAGRLGATQEIKNAVTLLNEQSKKERMQLGNMIYQILPSAIKNSITLELIEFKELSLVTEVSALVENAILGSMTLKEKRVLASQIFDDIFIDTSADPSIDSETKEVVLVEKVQGNDPNDVNDNIKKLSGREFQNLQRIIRKYHQGKSTFEEAATLLKSGFGLTDQEINQLLGVNEQEDDPANITE